ncbi:ribonuclease HII [bacterium]|nr:ribonuclease HII [bacterium]
MNKLFDFDKKELSSYKYLLGTDEAGRGPGAGPVFAACVCFKNPDKTLIKDLSLLNDSKQLTEKIRNELYPIIIENSIYSIHQGSVEDIEKYNILRTSLNTMKKCALDVINQLEEKNIILLVDGNKRIFNFEYDQKAVIKGDSKSAAIAAASILAKVSRDNFMLELDKQFPMYSWAENKGYMTKSHLDAVDKFGLTKWHRKKFFTKHFESAKQLSLLN